MVCRLTLSGTQGVVAHLALDAAGIHAVATGADTLLEDLPEDLFMKGFLLVRGEEPRSGPSAVERHGPHAGRRSGRGLRWPATRPHA